MTRNLLLGSEAPLSRFSASASGSGMPSSYSRPFFVGSATDMASTAIEFSKGNVEDGVVDRSPSRGLVRTPTLLALPYEEVYLYAKSVVLAVTTSAYPIHSSQEAIRGR